MFSHIFNVPNKLVSTSFTFRKFIQHGQPPRATRFFFLFVIFIAFKVDHFTGPVLLSKDEHQNLFSV